MATPLVAVAWGGADNPRGAWSANDAASWTTVNLPTFANGSGGSWSGLAYSPKLGMFVAIASGGDNNNNAVARSTDNGHSWTGTAVPNPGTWTMNGICWAGTLGLFVIVTSAGPTTSARVLTSPDGINWTARSLPVDRRCAEFGLLVVRSGPVGRGGRQQRGLHVAGRDQLEPAHRADQ